MKKGIGVPMTEEVKKLQIVNKALQHGLRFYVYRSEEGQVHKYEVWMLGIWGDLYTLPHELSVQYEKNGEIVNEKASKQDLLLIWQEGRRQAEQLQMTQKGGK